MENYDIKINVVTFFFMFSLPVKLQKILNTQRNDSISCHKSLLKEIFYLHDT